MVKYEMIGASILLVLGILILVPAIQKNVARLIGSFMPRQWLSYAGVIFIVTWIYVVVPRLNFVLGLTFISLSLVMIFAVPNNPQIRAWVSEMFFTGNDIFDVNAPYADVVDLFRWPLFGLGVYIVCQQMLIVLDLMPIAFALYVWRKRVKKAEIKMQQSNSGEMQSMYNI